MDSIQLLLHKYKKRHYDDTRRRIQKKIILIGTICCIVGMIFTAIIYKNPIIMYANIGGTALCVMSISLMKFKKFTINTACLILGIYFCFVYVPTGWYIYNGIFGSAPYVALTIMTIVLLVFTGKMQKIMLGAYIIELAALTVYSTIRATYDSVSISEIVTQTTVFFVAVLLISYSLMYLLKRYERINEQFLSKSIKDGLTGVFDRRVLAEIVEIQEEKYRSKKIDYLLVMLDLDRFKKLNDEFGHTMGDIMLQKFARCIKDSIRASDFVVRYGGDEFLVVLSHASISVAKSIFDRIEDTLRRTSIIDFEISISRGFAKRSECKDADEVLALADKRMYQDKESSAQLSFTNIGTLEKRNEISLPKKQLSLR